MPERVRTGARPELLALSPAPFGGGACWLLGVVVALSVDSSSQCWALSARSVLSLSLSPLVVECERGRLLSLLAFFVLHTVLLSASCSLCSLSLSLARRGYHSSSAPESFALLGRLVVPYSLARRPLLALSFFECSLVSLSLIVSFYGLS